MKIYDKEKRKWYEVRRGYFNRLMLREIVYENVRRFPTSSDLVYSCGKLSQFKRKERPPTPQPVISDAYMKLKE